MKYKTKWIGLDLSKESLSSLLDNIPDLVVLEMYEPEYYKQLLLKGVCCRGVVIGSGDLDAKPLLKVESSWNFLDHYKEEVTNCYLAIT